jgi:hypothetical protein
MLQMTHEFDDGDRSTWLNTNDHGCGEMIVA